MKMISSSSNPEIKKIKFLISKSRERKRQKLFVVEGKREITRAYQSGYDIVSIFYRENFNENIKRNKNIVFYEVEKTLFDKICIRSGSEKMIAIVKAKELKLDKLILTKKARVLVIESPEKPGNIGAILRTAAAAEIDAIIISNIKTDIYHPNIIRSSLGGIFFLQIAIDNSNRTINFLKNNKISIISTSLSEKATNYNEIIYKTPFALIFGSEDKGLSPIWFENSNQIAKIPTNETIDSLNLSVSAGILIYHSLNH